MGASRLLLLALASVLSLQSFISAEGLEMELDLPRAGAEQRLPLVISTWPFVEAVRAAWGVVDGGGSLWTPWWQDAAHARDFAATDQTTMDVGAVGALRFVKEAIQAARLVMEQSDHTLLVGDQASDFAVSMGLPGGVNLSTDDSLSIWSSWRSSNCQPNFWRNVSPDPKTSCGPYHGQDSKALHPQSLQLVGAERETRRDSSGKGFGRWNHDTISMAVISKSGSIAVGTSTNGATYKLPGRVGDGPIVGAAAYADDEVGACGATGDGDVMMRFLPCYQVVESMRQGKSPLSAARDAIARIRKKFPLFVGAVFAVDRTGKHAGACHGWTFQYSVKGQDMGDVQIYTITPSP